MITGGTAATLSLILVTVLAQAGRGTITGTITNPANGKVQGVLIQAKLTSNGIVYKAESLKNGTYTISQLPAGTYEISIPETGYALAGYSRKDLAVSDGQTVRHDVRLDWFDLGTLGDDVYLEAHNKNAARKLTGKTPRMPNGKPDLSGVWLGSRDTNPEAADALPWAMDILKERIANFGRDLPSADCLPGDVVPSSPLPYKIIQTSALLVQLFDGEPHFRQVFLDGRPHPKDPDPTWTGHSIGKWDRDTLVIDTVGFNDKSWLPNMMPHTDKLHVVERYSRRDLGHLNVDITLEDPGTFKKPWHIRLVWELAPDEEIPETVCAENNRYYRELAGETTAPGPGK